MQRAIVLNPLAAAQMDRLSDTARALIEEKLIVLATNPGALANQIKRLKGSVLLRLRVGDYRVIYTDSGIVVAVQSVGHRGDVYR